MEISGPREAAPGLVVTSGVCYLMAYSYAFNTSGRVVTLPGDAVWVIAYFAAERPLLSLGMVAFVLFASFVMKPASGPH